MPFYISTSLLISAYSEDTLVLDADDDGDGDLEPGKVEQALRAAEAEVNTYIAVCYILPLVGVTDRVDPENNAAVPPELVRVCTDIAMYRLVPRHDRLTKERRRRYEDAVAWLAKLARKEVTLSLVSPVSGGVSRSGPVRIFTRSTMDGLL